MLERVNEVFKIDFRYDLELITMLSTHLMPLEIRAKHGIAVHNSLAAQLFKHFNTGISYFLPVIIAGGMLFPFTLITGKIDNGAIVPSNQSFQNIYDIGQAGFLDSLILGFVVGYFVKWTKSWKVSDVLKPMMPTFFILVITTLILGLFYTYVLTYPLNAFVQAIVSIMNQLNGTSTVIVGIVLILAFTKPNLEEI